MTLAPTFTPDRTLAELMRDLPQASEVFEENGRKIPSPRITARMPCSQPRQLSCAITTVMKEMIKPSTAKNQKMSFLVSTLRRDMKLKSCTRIREPRLASSFW